MLNGRRLDRLHLVVLRDNDGAEKLLDSYAPVLGFLDHHSMDKRVYGDEDLRPQTDSSSAWSYASIADVRRLMTQDIVSVHSHLTDLEPEGDMVRV